MDYNEWLLDYYTITYAPMTSSDSFARLVGIIAAGGLITSFGSIIFGFYSDSFFTTIMPTITSTYTNSFYTPVDNFLLGTISPFFS